MDPQKRFLASTLQGAIDADVVSLQDLYRHMSADVLAEHVPGEILWTVLTEGMGRAGLGFSGRGSSRQVQTSEPATGGAPTSEADVEAAPAPEGAPAPAPETAPAPAPDAEPEPAPDAEAAPAPDAEPEPAGFRAGDSIEVAIDEELDIMEGEVSADLDEMFDKATDGAASSGDNLEFEDDHGELIVDEDWDDERD